MPFTRETPRIEVRKAVRLWRFCWLKTWPIIQRKTLNLMVNFGTVTTFSIFKTMSKFEQDNSLKVSGKFAKKWFVLKRNSVGYKSPNVSSWESFIICDLTGTRWLFTALFKNTHIPKFKGQLAFTFFAVVNHFREPRRKQMFSSTASKGHGLWFLIGGFRSVLCVSVFQGSLLVIVIMSDGSEKRSCEGGF